MRQTISHIQHFSTKELKHPWLLFIVLVLVINAFNTMMMISHHQSSAQPQTQISAILDHDHGDAMHHESHCGSDNQSACGENTADMECSISQCSPVGIIGLAFNSSVDSGSSVYQDAISDYQSLASDSPYIPPISAHI